MTKTQLSQPQKRLISLKPLSLFTFVCIFVIGLCIVLGVLPSQQPVEGKLLVQSLNFTSNQNDTLFLKDAKLTQLRLSVEQPLTLPGDFDSSDYPQLNPLEQLDIAPSFEGSSLTITLTPTGTLSLEELRIQRDDQINNLKYAPFNQTLSFHLNPTDNDSPVTLLLEPDSEPITVSISNYQLTNVNLANPPETLEFQLDTSEFDFEISQPLQAYLTLIANNQPIWGEMAVKAVSFEKTSQTGDNDADNRQQSTIVDGEVRMAQQQQPLLKDQFLSLSPPGIQILNRLQIVRPDPKPKLSLSTPDGNLTLSSKESGINVSFSGHTKTLKIGLNQELPITTIRGSYLARFLPQNIIVLIISFAIGLISSLLTWYLDKLGKKS